MENESNWGGRRSNAGRKSALIKGKMLWIPAPLVDEVETLLASYKEKKSMPESENSLTPESSNSLMLDGFRRANRKDMERLPISIRKQLIKQFGNLTLAVKYRVYVNGRRILVGSESVENSQKMALSPCIYN